MKVRAIRDLAQLSDENFFQEVSSGMGLVIGNASKINADADHLKKSDHKRGASILYAVAEEEVAKFFILLDAVRCPRHNSDERARQLGYFNNHLAKGIYAEYCGSRPAKFIEVRDWVELERKEYYADGPTGSDWIFYNDILRKREETLYVDYVQNDAGHVWHDPIKYEAIGASFRDIKARTALRLAIALVDIGASQSEGLDTIAKRWRAVEIGDDMTWGEIEELNQQTAEDLVNQGLANSKSSEAIVRVNTEWLFPLYPLDLKKQEIKKAEMEDLRERRHPL